MTQPNPFAPPAPAATAPVAEPAVASPNPFAAPATQQAAPAAPAWLAQPTAAEQASYVRPPGVDHMQHVANTTPYTPPALNLGAMNAAPPPPPSGGKGADLPAMYGRLLLVLPTRVDTVPRQPQFITAEQRAAGNVNQERLTATVVVLDDGQGGQQPIAWGGAPHKMPPTPHTNSDPLPYVRKAMWINQSKLIAQLLDYLPANRGGEQGMAVGRAVKTGPAHNDPWYLTQATEQEMAVAKYYLEAVGRGQFPHPLAP